MKTRVQVSKLFQMFNPFESDTWGFGIPLTVSGVQECLNSGKLCGHDAWSNLRNIDNIDEADHNARVAFLIVHGWNDPIDIDVGVPDLQCYTDHPIVDGNHRIAAAIFLKRKTIRANLTGQIKYLKHLLIRSPPLHGQ